MGAAIRVSVVTIAYNEAETIARTIESVLGQSYPNVEYIVVDGGSLDGTVDKIRRLADAFSSSSPAARSLHWTSERDRGLYDGMNKGLARCSGDYVIFCNAGDQFASDDVIEKMVEKAEADDWPDLVYGDCISVIDNRKMIRSAHGPGFMKFGMPAAHEAMMYKLSIIRERDLRYDLTYRIAADYRFTYQFVSAAKSFAYVGIPVVVFSEGGVSTANRWKGLSEACRARKEVANLSCFERLWILLAQSGALILSQYAGPLYRAIRLRKGR